MGLRSSCFSTFSDLANVGHENRFSVRQYFNTSVKTKPSAVSLQSRPSVLTFLSCPGRESFLRVRAIY